MWIRIARLEGAADDREENIEEIRMRQGRAQADGPRSRVH